MDVAWQAFIEQLTGSAGAIVALGTIMWYYVAKIKPAEDKRNDEREARFQAHSDADRKDYRESLEKVADTCNAHMKTVTDAHDKAFDMLAKSIDRNTAKMDEMALLYSRASNISLNGGLHEQRDVSASVSNPARLER